MQLFYNYPQLFFFVHPCSFFIKKFYSSQYGIKMNIQCHILWRIFNSCMLYWCNVIGCLYSTIILNSSYFVYLLLFFTLVYKVSKNEKVVPQSSVKPQLVFTALIQYYGVPPTHSVIEFIRIVFSVIFINYV